MAENEAKKTLQNIAVEGNIEGTSKEEARANNLEELQQLSMVIRDCYKTFKSAEKILEDKKQEFKKMAKELDVDLVENEKIKISLSTVDKSFLDVEPTIAFLRNSGMTQYIHQKDYFMDEEITLAISRREIEPQDLAPFLISKSETRMNIKVK